MKKVFLLFLILVLLSACTKESNDSVLTESSTSTSESTVASTEPSTSTSEPTVDSNEPYSFSEVNPLFGPGPFSVNDLAEIFGEPDYTYGYYIERSDYFILVVSFEDIKFDLAANNGEKLNFIKNKSKSPDDYHRYEVTESDKDVRIKPQSVRVGGGDWELPRGMNFGDSIDMLYDAYNGNKGREINASEGRRMVIYDYEESGEISYFFNGDTDKLEQVVIEWYRENNFGGVSNLPPT